MSNDSHEDGRRTTAYILLAIAAYIVLANTGFLDAFGLGNLIGWAFRILWSLIPLGILVAGIVWLGRSKDENRQVFPWLIVGFGAILLASQFNLFGLTFGEMILPFWLVIVALMIMNPRKLLPNFLNKSNIELDEDGQEIKLVAFMGGGELDYSSRSLNGGEIMAIMGGYQIDFSESDMEGDSMILNLICVMGGVEITVPSNWEVEKRGAICIMGGISNKTKCLAEKLELPRKKLIVSGFALMGGGEIKN